MARVGRMSLAFGSLERGLRLCGSRVWRVRPSIVCRWRQRWSEANPIQTDRTQSGFPGRVDEGWQERRMRRNTNPIQTGRTELRLHRTGGWLDERIDRAPSPTSYSRSVGTPAPQAGATLDGTRFVCEPPQARRSRSAGWTQASSAGRSQEVVLRAFVRMDEGRWRLLAFRRWSCSALRHSGTKCGERFGVTGACWLRGVSRTMDRSLRGWRNWDKSDRMNALWRSDGTRCGAFRCDAACVSRLRQVTTQGRSERRPFVRFERGDDFGQTLLTDDGCLMAVGSAPQERAVSFCGNDG